MKDTEDGRGDDFLIHSLQRAVLGEKVERKLEEKERKVHQSSLNDWKFFSWF